MTIPEWKMYPCVCRLYRYFGYVGKYKWNKVENTKWQISITARYRKLYSLRLKRTLTHLITFQMIKSCSHFRVFSHFSHLLFSFWNWNRNSVGAGQSRVPGRYWVNNLTETGGNTAGWETRKADQYWVKNNMLNSEKIKQKQSYARFGMTNQIATGQKNIPARFKRWW